MNTEPDTSLDKFARAMVSLELENHALKTAVQFAKSWAWNPDEDPNGQFERIGDMFQFETGYLRPGKSYPDVSPAPENLQKIWDEWRTEQSRKLHVLCDFAIKTCEEFNG